jgi:hypothetical protein
MFTEYRNYYLLSDSQFTSCKISKALGLKDKALSRYLTLKTPFANLFKSNSNARWLKKSNKYILEPLISIPLLNFFHKPIRLEEFYKLRQM